MSIVINLYSFSKKENSTARPSGNGASYNIVLKEDCGIVSPIIEFDIGMSNPAEYNYAYIPAFNRYYYIVEWSYVNRKWVANLVCDVLASYKDQIGATDLYILRSSAQSDGTIIDDMYPIKNYFTSTENNTNVWNADGFYVLGVFSNSAGVGGAITYYVFTQSQFDNFKSFLFKNDAGGSWYENLANEIGENLAKAIINPMQYIASCKWFPLTAPGIIGEYRSKVDFGYYSLPVETKLMMITRLSSNFEIAFSKHPQASARGNYLNLAPYSQYCLTLLPFGSVVIDNKILTNSNKVKCNLNTDLISGNASLYVYNENNTLITVRNTQLAVDIPLQQQTSNVVSGVAGIGATALGALTGDMALASAGIKSVASSIGGDSLSSGASPAGFAIYSKSATMFSYFWNVVDEDNAHNGRPLCAIRKPSALGGYMMVQDADISIAGTLSENNEIKSKLESGFYYE